MPIDPVQSIRVATNLAERFGALTTPGTMTVSELELKIGEAQQLYPEIWRHLDEARAALAEQGRDVSAYDHLRGDEQAILGVTGIESTQGFNMLSGSQYQHKSATMNVAGYRRALEASQALMRVMPEIDWVALAREEERQIRAAGSLHTGKWFGSAKMIVIAAALLGVAIIIYRVMTSIEEERPKQPTRDQELVAYGDRVQEEAQRDRLALLREQYAATCDRAIGKRLAEALREAAQVTAASKIETERCEPKRASCGDVVKQAIGARIASSFGLVEDKAWSMACQGVVLQRGAGPEIWLAVLIVANDQQGKRQAVRGLASIDGTADPIRFGGAPGTKLAGVGDLDGDGGDELVFVDTTSLTVSKATGAGWTDIAGPAMPKGCAADANIEGDFRNGRDGKTKALVLTVPDDVKGKQCLKPGRHYYALQGATLSETD